MVGQPIGCIVAEDVQTARRAAKLVKVEYEKLPAILTIEVSSPRSLRFVMNCFPLFGDLQELLRLPEKIRSSTHYTGRNRRQELLERGACDLWEEARGNR